MTITIGNMNIDSSSRIKHVKSQSVAAVGTSYTRNPLGIKKPSEEIVVGLGHEVEIIWNKIIEDTKQLCVISVVGMGDSVRPPFLTKYFVVYHFHVRAWVTGSQTYKR